MLLRAPCRNEEKTARGTREREGGFHWCVVFLSPGGREEQYTAGAARTQIQPLCLMSSVPIAIWRYHKISELYIPTSDRLLTSFWSFTNLKSHLRDYFILITVTHAGSLKYHHIPESHPCINCNYLAPNAVPWTLLQSHWFLDRLSRSYSLCVNNLPYFCLRF